ncbi:polynucleotide kinase 3 phosphatase-domain-containing protein [Scheffersomyces xylosifermentans]|uniref:polynucleotide kinase 3 phosphatase-domain-containing protein n=1 Tax=Scheffersomyces xylosifermentans TaxID=1304137 RepID=UPI00315CE1E3
MSKDILSHFKQKSDNSGKITKPSSDSSMRPSSNVATKVAQNITSKPLLDSNVTKVVQKVAPAISTSKVSFPQRWQIVGSHLIKNVPKDTQFIRTLHTDRDSEVEDGNKNLVKVAAFDLDGTLISTKSGSTFSRSPNDWKFWHRNDKQESESVVVRKLNELVAKKYLIVIFTNQGAVVANPTMKSYTNFTKKLNDIVNKIKEGIESKDTEILVFAAPKKPAKNASKSSSDEQFAYVRKPGRGMWDELTTYLRDKAGYEVDIENSIFVGDAAGRDGDFSDSDLMFAKNVKCEFNTPEEFFQLE